MSRGALQLTHRRLGGGGTLVCAQCGGYATDNLLTQEHPEMADTIDRDGFHLGVDRHRPQARHDDIECGRHR
jgi:hypothetical protein